MNLSRRVFNTCPFCGQGELLVVKESKSGIFLIMCDDCETQWATPEDSKFSSKSLLTEHQQVQDATQDEIRTLGWAQFLKGD